MKNGGIEMLVDWDQLRGNQFSLGLKKEMLREQGLILQKRRALLGDSIDPDSRYDAQNQPGKRGKFPKKEVTVVYGRDYIEKYIQSKVLIPLGFKNLRELLNEFQNSSIY
jgi:hypothetical protein